MSAVDIDHVLPEVLADLKSLIAIPSVSSMPEHAADVKASADAVATLLRDVGCPDVRVVAEGGQPAVIGRFPAPDGMPTVCLYAHHDVQPSGDSALWTSAPFAATERGDRLYARGAADDKGGIGVHLAALRAFEGRPPVGITVFIEGEEEIGSPSLGRIIERHKDLLEADCYVIADAVNWQVGEPAFTTRLRGMARVVVEVQTLSHAVHSGQFGGAIPDALTAMIQLLATLHDKDGAVAVAGLGTCDSFGLEYDEERIRDESGLLKGVDLIGAGTVADRLWAGPAITVIGLDATPVALASNTLAPSVKAMIGMRVAPGHDSMAQAQLVCDHLVEHAPWGAKVSATITEAGDPGVVPSDGPYYAAARAALEASFGVAPIDAGCGASIPLVAEFQEAFPEASIILTAVTDPDSRMHGIDESLHLGDFVKACKGEVGFLERVAAQGRD